jgi:predicted tellurium resistance membrane protein TerC
MLELFTIENGVALVTLTILEIVLGIDNIVFIAIVAGKLGDRLRNKARIVGLCLAIITRLMLLFTLSFLASLTEPFVTVMEKGFSGRDLILIAGGVFLIYKATREIHAKTTGEGDDLDVSDRGRPTFRSVVTQIVLIDIIFSLDSVITAVGMTNNLPVMSAAVILAVVVMLIFSGKIVEFIDANPTIKMLAISFLLMIGLVLVADGFGRHIEKAYVYFAMGFSLFVETLNLRAAKTGGTVEASSADEPPSAKHG